MDTILLLSGGLDSAVILAEAISQGKKVLALSFDYGQRHRIELDFARKLAEHYGAKHLIIKIDPQAFGQSSLVTHENVPKDRTSEEIKEKGNNSTYVPARNTLFLAYAIVQAELHQAKEILYGPNALDKYCFPDCDGDYVQAMQRVIDQTMKQTLKENAPQVRTPLIDLDKEAIVRKAIELRVPIEMTLSCYDPTSDGTHCGRCDACVLRQDGFSRGQN